MENGTVVSTKMSEERNSKAVAPAGSDADSQDRTWRDRHDNAIAELVDPTTVPDAVYEKLLDRQSVSGCYADDNVETAFLLYFHHWRFLSTSVLGVFLAIFWILNLYRMLVDPRDRGPAMEFGSLVMLFVMLAVAVANWIYAVRGADEFKAKLIPEQYIFLRVCEVLRNLTIFLGFLFAYFALDTEVTCRYTAKTATEANNCRHHGYSSLVRFCVGYALYGRIRRVSLVVQFIPYIIFPWVRVGVMRGAPFTPSVVEEAMFFVTLYGFMACAAAAFLVLDQRCRQEFEYWLHRKRTARLLEFHRNRMRTIVANLLPDDSVMKIRRGEPVIDKKPNAVIAVTRVHQFSEWRNTCPPNIAALLVDVVFSSFDLAVDKYDCEKIQLTDELYIVARGLRRNLPSSSRVPLAAPAIYYCFFQQRLANKFAAVNEVKFSSAIHQAEAIGAFVGSHTLLYTVCGPSVDGALLMSARCEDGHTIACSKAAAEDSVPIFHFQRESLLESDRLRAPIPYYAFVKRRVGATYSKPLESSEISLAEESVPSSDMLELSAAAGSGNSALEVSEQMMVKKRVDPLVAAERRAFLREKSLQWQKERAVRGELSAFEKGDDRRAKSVRRGVHSPLPQLDSNLEDDTDPAQVTLAAVSVPRHPVLALTLGTLDSQAEAAFWQSQDERATWVYSVDRIVYLLFGTLILLDIVMEEAHTGLSLALLLVGFAFSIFRWAAAVSGNALHRYIDFGLQIIILALYSVGTFKSRRAFLNGNSLAMQAMMCLSLYTGCFRIFWMITALPVIGLTVLNLILKGAELSRLYGGLSDVFTMLIYLYLMWEFEFRRRDMFADQYQSKGLQLSIERELLWTRGLLHMLVPPFLVERVATKTVSNGCLTLALAYCVVSDVLFPPSLEDQTRDLTTLFSYIESAFTMVPDSSLISVVGMVGDTLKFAGPMLQPEKPDGPQLYASAVEMKRFQIDSSTKTEEVNACRAAVALLRILRMLRSQHHMGFTTVVVLESAYVAVMGSIQPSFQVTGQASKLAAALTMAAPDGYFGVTAKLANLLPVVIPGTAEEFGLPAVPINDVPPIGSTQAAGTTIDPSDTDHHFEHQLAKDLTPSPSKWRIKNVGIVYTLPVSSQ